MSHSALRKLHMHALHKKYPRIWKLKETHFNNFTEDFSLENFLRNFHHLVTTQKLIILSGYS